MTDAAAGGPPRLARLASVGLACAALTWLAGLVWVPLRHADSTAGLRARVERELRDSVNDRVDTLADVARRLRAGDPAGLLRTSPTDVAPLFDLASSAVSIAGAADYGVTLYGPDRVPLAWAGRSSALPARLVAAPAGAVVLRGSAGLYLVWVEPITGPPGEAAGGEARQPGTIVVETVLAESERGAAGAEDRFAFATSVVPVTLRLPEDAAPSSDDLVVLRDGEPLVVASVAESDLTVIRERARSAVTRSAIGVIAVTVLALAAALATGRRERAAGTYAIATGGAIALFVAGRLLTGLAAPPSWAEGSLRSPAVYTSTLLGPLTASPLALLLTGLLALTIVCVLVDPVRRWSASLRRTRIGPLSSRTSLLLFVAAQLLAGVVLWSVARGVDRLVADTVANTSVDVLWLSWQPWSAGRLAVQFGMVAAQVAAFWAAVLVLRVGLMPFRLSRRPAAIACATALWLLPAAIGLLTATTPDDPLSAGGLLMLLAAPAAAWISLRGLGWYYRGSRALQLATLFLLVVVPALILLPTLERHTDRVRRGLIETLYASQVTGHAVEVQTRLSSSLQQIDRLSWLPELLGGREVRAAVPVGEAAFAVWSQTDLAEFRLTSAVELYGVDDELVSRFALNFPEYGVAAQAWDGDSCQWETFGEAMPFGSGERRVLRAGRRVCLERGRGVDIVGSVVVEVVLDYGALPFISRQDPYVQLFSRDEPSTPGAHAGQDIELAIYGWGRYPLYTSSGRAWPLPDALFQRIYASREPFWAALPSGGEMYEVFVANDPLGIYALGYPVRGPVEQLVLASEVVVLVALGFVAGGVLVGLFGIVSAGWRRPGRRLWQEIRTSFYRRLFLSFVLAAVVPVLILAFVATQFVAARLRESVEAEAASTAAVAQRVIEETLALQEAAGQPAVINDDLMVWISRVIGQDVNIFEGPELVATSERDLFASGLLPMRTPEAVYRAIMLDRLPSYVGEDRIGDFRYLTAAAPVQVAARQSILTVPLTLRQQEIERQIDDLRRGVNLGAVVFVLLGAGIGFWMAERIGDPVQRLTRAARRIASGDLDTRVAVRTADELGRLVGAFNRMADDLVRQRAQLERTHRLEAWAQMARQVAHDIKNPLTPIQLSAEHARRVNRDKGAPLSPALDACVDAILSQVRLLRQIAGEFSAFALTPVARPAATDLADLVEEVVRPYRPGVEGRVRIDVAVDPGLPRVSVDRQLLGRALTNVIENALHSMPAGGVLSLAVSLTDGLVALRVRDTGVGMDQDDLRRVFEPYFSTKASGTGLGLSIARRNVELQGGRIAVESRRGEGTTVTITLPASASDGAAGDRSG